MVPQLNEHERLVDEDDNISWECTICEIADMASKFPFGYLTTIELNDLFGLDLPSQLQLLLPLELRSKLSHIPSLDNFYLDENYIQSIHSEYCDLPDFVKLSSSLSYKIFSLFHSNTRSPSKNFDQLQNVLSSTKTRFDVIGITETKQQIDNDFLVIVDMEGYQMHTQPSQSNEGGVVTYIDEKLDHFKRDDLRKLDENVEAVWVEIKIKKAKAFSAVVCVETPIPMLPVLLNIWRQHAQR